MHERAVGTRVQTTVTQHALQPRDLPDEMQAPRVRFKLLKCGQLFVIKVGDRSNAKPK